MTEVTELHPVPDAHVPVMRLKLNGVSIDLLYAKLSLWVIPEVSDLSKINRLKLFLHILWFLVILAAVCGTELGYITGVNITKCR